MLFGFLIVYIREWRTLSHKALMVNILSFSGQQMEALSWLPGSPPLAGKHSRYANDGCGYNPIQLDLQRELLDRLLSKVTMCCPSVSCPPRSISSVASGIFQASCHRRNGHEHLQSFAMPTVLHTPLLLLHLVSSVIQQSSRTSISIMSTLNISLAAPRQNCRFILGKQDSKSVFCLFLFCCFVCLFVPLPHNAVQL